VVLPGDRLALEALALKLLPCKKYVTTKIRGRAAISAAGTVQRRRKELSML
jgi:hypothetical protein